MRLTHPPLWAVLLVCSGIFSRAVAEDAVIDRIAAVVGDDVITLSDIYTIGADYVAQQCPTAESTCREQAEQEILEALITRTLQRQELRRLSQDVTPADVDMQIDGIVQEYQFANRDALRAEIEGSGVTWAQYREQLQDQIRDMKFRELVLRSRVTITKDEIQDAYQRRIRGQATPDVVTLAAIAMRLPGESAQWPDLVADLRKDLALVRDGALDWTALAEKWDTLHLGPVFEDHPFTRKDLNDQLAEVAFSLEVGEVSEPIIASGVLYALRVVERGVSQGDTPTLDALRDDIVNTLGEQKLNDAAEEWEARARRQTVIHVLLTDAETAAPDATAIVDQPEKPDLKAERAAKRRAARERARATHGTLDDADPLQPF